MSDQPATPPKPKVGSLRDRIAAFEKSASAAAPAPAPAPRPKPAGFASWKPKVPSPPSSPSATSSAPAEHAAPSGTRAGGMSATDAKESITKAGSLKDRMAALQGKGAFGAPPPLAPKPALEKPKWKPPPVVHAPIDDDDGPPGEGTSIAAAVERTLSPPTSVLSRESHETSKSGEGEDEAAASVSPPVGADAVDEGDAAPADPEDEERQRRAAIAARMARLGGARVGMAPPMFGKKPPVRRPTQEDAPPTEAKPEVREVAPSPETPKSEEIGQAPADKVEEEPQVIADSSASSEYFPKRKNSENASILSAESADSPTVKPPASMPVPVVPRRAGPPRKKPAKPTAAVPEVPEESLNVADEPKEEPKDVTAAISGEEQDTSPPKEVNIENEGEADAKDADQIVTPDDPTPVPVIEAKSPQLEVREPVEDTEVDVAEARSSSTGTVPTEEASGIASPPPSISPMDETPDLHEEESPGVLDVDFKSLPAHHHPAPLHEPSVLQKVDEKLQAEVSTPVASTEKDGEVEQEKEKEEVDDEEEEEEEARKKRVAERMAKMGGVNPFAPQVKSHTAGALSPPATAAPTLTDEEPTPPVVPVEKSSDAQLPSSPKTVTEPAAQTGSFVDFDNDEEDVGVYEDDGEHSQYESSLHTGPDKNDEATHLKPQSPVSTPGAIPTAHPSIQVQKFSDSDEVNSESEYDEDLTGRRTASVDTPPGQHPSSPPARPVQPPRRLIPQAPEPSDDEEEEEIGEEDDERLAQSQLFVPPPPGQRTSADVFPPRRLAYEEEDGDGSESDSAALPVPSRRSVEVPVARSPSPPSDYTSEPESDHDGEALPVLARNVSAHSSPSIPSPPQRQAPPSPPQISHEESPQPVQRSPPIRRAIPPAPTAYSQSRDYPPISSPTLLTPTGFSVSGSEEVLDDEEGDPIDPEFHSPSRRTSSVNLQAMAQAQAGSATRILSPSATPLSSSPPPAPQRQASSATEQTEPDSEQLRRQTIAERMARLGGIKFGSAPVPSPAARPQNNVSQDDQEHTTPDVKEDEETPDALSEEEEERARKERIAAKMANMGGMRIGMMPMGMGHLPPQRSHILRADSDTPKAPSPPPTRTVPPSRPQAPPPPPPPADIDSDYGSGAASEDGVKVEAEESEPDEVDYPDAAVPEEAPPPIPSRETRGPPGRQASTDRALASPPLPSPRPPVPTSMPNRRSSVQTTRSTTSSSAGGGDNTYGTPPRKSSGFMPPPQSEYVMVEEPEEQEVPPPPPARPTSRLPPTRSTPSIPQVPAQRSTTNDPSDSISSQWELPSIPVSALDFGGDTDLSLSWTDAGAEKSEPAPPPPPPAKRAAASYSELQLSADDLMAMWGRVGVQVCEVATSMFDRSKKALVGDGTYAGFVQAVLALVPNAAPVPSAAGEWGYLVYLQNGPAVQRRASEIMPGDIVELHDAKLKGHKGLQMYHQAVGAGEVLVGVVGEFEAKKAKIRVFHANQHVGQQTVESVSYRLEDLKTGVVKVYRVLEA